MRAQGTALALCVLFGSMAVPLPAGATARNGQTEAAAHTAPARQHQPATEAPGASASRRGSAKRQVAASSGAVAGLSCVPFARMVTGMEVRGNGGTWWYNAAGVYARGQRPEPGSVMVFRASGGMARGHVAVVSRVLGPRNVLVDHANWAGPGIRRGSVMRNVSVIDVSEHNDWTAVRVQVGHDPSSYGRIYPTYGFIYNRPDTATAYAAAPVRNGAQWEELAEMPQGTAAATSPRR